MPKNQQLHGFTLIELSIVLVIIGLIAGGVLFGKDLIFVARLRQQISQIEQFDTAQSTFRLKYNAIPGDLSPEKADALGMAARSGDPGHGDGNGQIEGCTHGTMSLIGSFGCEHALFWGDLSVAQLISQDFSANDDNPPVANTVQEVFNFFPKMIAATNASTHVHSDGTHNWYIFSHINALRADNTWAANAIGVEGAIAYGIDAKIDDGLPLEGIAQVGGYGGFAHHQIFFNPPSTNAISCLTATDEYKHVPQSNIGIYCNVFQVRASGL